MPGPNRLARIPEMAGNSPFKEYPSPFMHGVIVFVDAERWTVTVQIYENGATQYNVPIMSPYFCRDKGQGAYFIPEVGSQCLVCYAYGQPFVLGFLPPVDSQSKGSEATDDLSEEAGTYVPEDKNPNVPPLTSYRNNREGEMLPGDFCIATKAKNKVKLFTNGNVLVEASKLCMRVYSKLKNWITDYCANYTLNTPGGRVDFTNDETTGNTNLTRKVRENIDNEEYAYAESIGDDADVSNRTVYDPEGNPTFTEQINRDGSVRITSMSGGHQIDLNSYEIRIDTTLAGINSITITSQGIVVSTDTKIVLTGPGGTLTIAPALSTWEVLGDLEVTVTGDGTIDTVGTLNLNPTPPFPYEEPGS